MLLKFILVRTNSIIAERDSQFSNGLGIVEARISIICLARQSN
jgi:hypothetical protein